MNEITTNTSFPIAKNHQLQVRSQKTKLLCEKFDVNLIVSKMHPSWSWDNMLDSYALNPLVKTEDHKQIVSVNLNGDRRTWIYEENKYYRSILLVGFEFNETKLKEFDYEIIDNNTILLKNNIISSNSFFKKLKNEFSVE